MSIQLVTAANNEQMVQIGLEQGADAIYMPLTGKLAIRLKRDFFSLSRLRQLIDLTHQKKKLAYPVINGIIREWEFNDYCDCAKTLFEYGTDGLVVGSVALTRWIAKNIKPLKTDFKIIASSSMSALSPDDANFLYEQGIDRVIVPRLHNMPQIEYYRKQAKGELELFVHGLLCPSWEGQSCLLPLFQHQQDFEEGCCLPQSVTDLSKVPCQQYQDNNKDSFWELKVQSDLPYLPQLINLGIDSIKVIAVGKDSPSLSKTIATWRKALDLALEGKPLPLNDMQQILKDASLLPIEFYTRNFKHLCQP